MSILAGSTRHERGTTITHGSEGPASLSAFVERRTEPRRPRVEAALILATVAAAFLFRFAQDDAFITYRFSRNLARGNGLVFNQGEQVEGYTNFLWAAVHAVPEALGWSSPWFSTVLGLACLAGVLAVTLRLATRLLGPGRGLVAGAALALNVTFIGYGTSGMETMLQTLLCTSTALLLLGAPTALFGALPRREALAGVLAGLAVLTRLDSVAYLAPMVLGALALGVRSGRRLRPSLIRIAAPAAAVVLPWLVWKWQTYGSLVPNTFLAKQGSSRLASWGYGLAYLAAFTITYGAVLLLPRLWRHRRALTSNPGGAVVVATILLWCGYVTAVGADFMEYRFMVPILPLLAMVAAVLIDEVRSVRGHVLLVGALLAASAFHAVQPKELSLPVLPFSNLRHWPTESASSWLHMGGLLQEAFPGEEGDPGRPTIAIAAAGVIPYTSDLTTVDMLGLTDAEVARSGRLLPIYFPGHVRIAEVPYLMQRGVDLVIGHPHVVPSEVDRRAYRLSELVAIHPGVDLRRLPAGAAVLEIPLTADLRWTVIELQRDPAVEAAARRLGWRRVPIERTCATEDLPNAVVELLARPTCP